MTKKIIRLEEIPVYLDPGNKWVKVYFDRVKFPDGEEGRYTRIVTGSGNKGVAILPILENKIGLIRLYRYPISQEVWEIPRGFGDSENSEENALRELKEETGLTAESLMDLGIIHPNSGLLAEEVHIFAASISDKTKKDIPDKKEVSEFQWFEIGDVFEMISKAQIKDVFTISACLRAKLKGLI